MHISNKTFFKKIFFIKTIKEGNKNIKVRHVFYITLLKKH